MQYPDDQIIIQGCLKGNRQAQSDLYQKYKSMLFGVCLRYASNHEEAEDILQDGFIAIYRDLYQYRPVGALGAWLRKVMVNTALQHLRKKKKMFSQVSLEKVYHLEDRDTDIFGQFRAKALVGMLQQLPDGYRTVFNMYVVEGYSHKEIAEQLNISESTSKSQLSRAKASLREKLEKEIC